jgi:hypothetical protein
MEWMASHVQYLCEVSIQSDESNISNKSNHSDDSCSDSCGNSCGKCHSDCSICPFDDDGEYDINDNILINAVNNAVNDNLDSDNVINDNVKYDKYDNSESTSKGQSFGWWSGPCVVIGAFC